MVPLGGQKSDSGGLLFELGGINSGAAGELQNLIIIIFIIM